MGLSVAITGSIILFTLMAVLFSISTMINSLVEVEDVSSQASELGESISETSTQIKSLSATSGSDIVQLSLANNGTEKLWDYDEFTLLITYDADIGGVKTMVTEEFSFDSINSFQPNTVYLIPESELTGGWTTENNCAVNNGWLCIDETPLIPPAPDNNDNIETANMDNGDQVQVEFGLSNEIIPSQVTDVTVHYTFAEENVGTSDPDLDITLLEGGITTIRTWTEVGPLPAEPTYGIASQALTPGEIATIGSYDDLSLDFAANCASAGCPGGGGGRFEHVFVSWGIVEVEGIITGGTNDWVISTITNDIIDPRILNNQEVANMAAKLSNQVFANGDVIVSISTDNGVTASYAITVS